MLLWFFYVIIFNEHFLKTDFIIFEVCNFYAFIIIIIFFFLHFCLYSIHESVGWNSMYYVSNQIRNEVAENLSD